MNRFSVLLALTGLVFFSARLCAWEYTYGTEGYEDAHSVCEASDGGFLAVGKAVDDLWLVKVDAAGATEWTSTYADAHGMCIQSTSGGFIIAGTRDETFLGNSFLLQKVDESGDILWTRTFGTEQCFGNSVYPVSDGGYIATGTNEQLWVLRTNSVGDTAWTRTFGVSGSGFCARQTTDGGYIVTGTIQPDAETTDDLCLIKLTAQGDTSWIKTYGNSSTYERGNSVVEADDGGFFVLGKYGSDIWLVRTDAAGDSLWSATLGTGNGHCIEMSSDGNLVLTGMFYGGLSKYELLLAKLDVNGNQVWRRTYGGDNDEWGYCIREASSGGFIVAGQTKSFGAGDYDMWLLRTDGAGSTSDITEESAEPGVFDIHRSIGNQVRLSYRDFPEGFRAVVFDVLGRRVDDIYRAEPSAEIEWGAAHQPGVYFIQETSTNTTRRLILTR